MLKLLLREDRHWLKTEYLFRFLSVTIIFGCVLFIILAIVLSAPYMLVVVEKSIVQNEIDKINNSEITQERKNFIEIAKRLSTKLKYIGSENYIPSLFITEAIASQPDGIGVNSINYRFERVEEKKQEKKEYVNLEIRGIALNRSVLINFQKQLQENEIFNSVNIPYSSFTKETDLPFTMNIKTVELINYFKENDEN